MDELSQKRFDKLVKLEIPAMTENDKLFLRSRRSYLSETQLERYASILKVKEEAKK